MLITNGGKLVRTRVSEISVLGRNTQGVKLIRLGEGERLVGIQRVAEVTELPADADADAVDATGTADLAGEIGRADGAEGPSDEDAPGDDMPDSEPLDDERPDGEG